MAAPVLTLVRGSDRDWRLQARDAKGVPVTTLLESDTYAGVVWPGDDTRALFAPAVALADPTTGAWTLAIAGSQTAGLAVGTYRIQATVARAGRTAVLFDGALEITAAPGSAAARPAYATAEDVRRWVPWIDQATDLKQRQANFAEELAEARDWTDDLLHRHYRGSGGLTRQQSLIMGVAVGGGLAARWRTGRRSPWLQQQLDADALILTGPTGRAIVRANAWYAIGACLDGQPGKRGDRPYSQMSADFYARADDLIATVTAELDTDGDGQPDVAIELGTIDVLRG